jgi:DNA-binding MarR family transcriptional regulator
MAAHLHETLPFLLNRVAGIVADEVNLVFRTMGLNVYSARVLILLYQDDASTVGELADKASLEQSTLSHILRRLQASGLLDKERPDHDNRTVIVTLTDKGYALAADCWAAVQSHDALLRKGLAAKDVAVLKDLLFKLYDNAPAFRLLTRASDVEAPPDAKAKAVAKPRPKTNRATIAKPARATIRR